MVQINAVANTDAGTASTTITVPSDAELILVGVGCYSSTTNADFSGGSLTFTKGGADTAMTSVRPTTTPDSTANWSGALFWMTLPDTGANKTLKWDWAQASGTTDRHALFAITFWKGCDTTSPIRASGGGKSASAPPYTADAMTATAGDLLYAWTAFFTGDTNGTTTDVVTAWSGGVSTLSGGSPTVYDTGGGDMATATAAGGSVTVAVTSATHAQDGVIYAIAIKPASLPAGSAAGVGAAAAQAASQGSASGVGAATGYQPGYGVGSTSGVGAASARGYAIPTGKWSLVGVSEAAINASGNYTLSEPAGCQQNDVLVVDFAARSTVIYTDADWTFPQSDSGGNTTNNTTASDTSAQVGYCIRGASAPTLVFSRTGGSRALGTIRAYRSSRPGVPRFDTSAINGLSSASTSVTVGTITTAEANELLVVGAYIARASATTAQFSALAAATDPTGASGAIDTSADPLYGTWTERSDRGNTTNPTVALALYDAVKATAGATGTITGTAANSALHVMAVMAFKFPPSGMGIAEGKGSATAVGVATPTPSAGSASGAGGATATGSSVASSAGSASGTGAASGAGVRVYPGTPKMVWWTSSSSNINAADAASGDNWKVRPANVTKAGNALILKISYPHGLTPTVTDNINGTWPAASATVDAGAGKLMSSVYVFPNAGAGAATVNVAFGSNITPFFFEYGEYMNVDAASPVNGTKTAANQTGSTISTGAFTPTTNNDVNGGNLVLAFFDEAINTGEDAPSSWAPSGSFTLLSADTGARAANIATGGTAGYGHATMEWLQSASASVTPTITPTGASSHTFNCAAIALKASGDGADRDAGIHVRRVLHSSQPNPATTDLEMQFPASGNLWVLEINLGDRVTSVKDSSDAFATAWTKEGSGSGYCGVFYREGVSPKNDLIIRVDGMPGAGYSGSTRFYDIEGAASSGALAQTKVTASGACSSVVVVNNAPTITPVAGAVNGLLIAGLSLGQGPSYGFTTGAPAGAFFDLVNYDTQTDSSTIDNSDGSAHYYVPSTTALNLNYSIKSIPGNSFDAVAVIFAAAPSSSVGSASGAGAATAVGASAARAPGVSAGAGASAGQAAPQGAASGSGTASAQAAATGSISGSGTASATAAGQGSAGGSGAASGVGQSTAAGAASASGVGSALAQSAGQGSSAGSGAASGVGMATAAASGSAAGLGAATGVGAGAGASAGVGAASAISAAIAAAAGSGAGTGSAAAAGASTAAAAGSAVGAGAAIAAGSGWFIVIGGASGAGQAAGVGVSTALGAGAAAGFGSAAATSPVTPSFGRASGIGAALGASFYIVSAARTVDVVFDGSRARVAEEIGRRVVEAVPQNREATAPGDHPRTAFAAGDIRAVNANAA